MTLRDFRDLTRHLPPATRIGLSFDEETGRNVITLREPDSNGAETVIDCGELEPLEDDEEQD